ncbi:hypothetical protein Tco_0386295 [Tanacetum coccineum]
MSSTETEYIVVAEASMEAVWMRKFIDGLRGVVPSNKRPIEMLCDNEPAIAIANDPRILKGARHLQRKYHYIRDVIQEHKIVLKKVHTDDNLVDPFTKPMSYDKHYEHAIAIGIVPARCISRSTDDVARLFVNVIFDKEKPGSSLDFLHGRFLDDDLADLSCFFSNIEQNHRSNGRKAHLVEDKQFPSVGVFDEVSCGRSDHFVVIGFVPVGGELIGEDIVVICGGNTDLVLWPVMVVTMVFVISSMTSCGDLHVTWAHIEKKRTRLRTNAKTLEDLCSQSLETASQAIHNAVTTHKVMASQHFKTALARTDSHADLEDSTYDGNADPSSNLESLSQESLDTTHAKFIAQISKLLAMRPTINSLLFKTINEIIDQSSDSEIFCLEERIKELELRTQRRNNFDEGMFKDRFPTEEELVYHKELLGEPQPSFSTLEPKNRRGDLWSL